MSRGQGTPTEHPGGPDRLRVLATPEELDAALDRLDGGTGPIAVDAERASGYRYSDRAYLIQLYRRGAGTILIDPVPFGSLAALQEVIGDEEWVFHAATQDLPCLRELDLEPERLFDTELGARLLGLERVGLGAVVEQLLGITLAKAHSADDWSTRPLPTSWLEYAALDVEHLVDVRDIMAELLAESGKDEIASAEFADVLTRELAPRRDEPWRRITGLTKLPSTRHLAVARELWLARDAYARERDVAPGRLVPDRSLSAVAKALPRSQQALAGLREFTGRESRSQLPRWWAAIERGLATDDLPPKRPVTYGGSSMPPHRSWAQRDPDADARLKTARPAVAEVAEALHMPTENLLTPELLRRVVWQPPRPVTTQAVAARLAELGAREWQIAHTAAVIAAAIVEADQVGPPQNDSHSEDNDGRP